MALRFIRIIVIYLLLTISDSTWLLDLLARLIEVLNLTWTYFNLIDITYYIAYSSCYCLLNYFCLVDNTIELILSNIMNNIRRLLILRLNTVFIINVFSKFHLNKIVNLLNYISLLNIDKLKAFTLSKVYYLNQILILFTINLNKQIANKILISHLVLGTEFIKISLRNYFIVIVFSHTVILFE